jgi:hypothetical protein
MTRLVSALCLGDAELPRLKESIRCFTGQTYAERELIVGVEPGSWRADAVDRYVRTLDAAVTVVPAATAGDLIGHARGDLLCAWSAAASSHPLRLAIQANTVASTGSRSCAALDWLRCVPAQRSLYWLGGTAAQPPTAGAAGTVLAEARVFADCVDALTAGRWPDGCALAGGGALIVEFGGPAAVEECLALEAAWPLLRPVGAALEAHRLPRPLMLHLRDGDTFAVVDPVLGPGSAFGEGT